MQDEKDKHMAIWNVVETSIGRNSKVFRLTDTLGIGIAQTVGCLVLLWGAVLEQREDGDISGWAHSEIERYAGWEGEKGKFAKALYRKENSFIDVIENKHLIHDWIEYAGRYLIKRYGTSNRERLIEIWNKHGRIYGQSQEETISKNKGRKNKIYADDSPEIKAAKYLFGKILDNDPKAKNPDFQKWAIEIDGILRLDKRTKEELKAVIDWCQNDNFWKSNILSAKKLRLQFAKLKLQMESQNVKGSGKKKSGYTFQKGKYPTLNT